MGLSEDSVSGPSADSDTRRDPGLGLGGWPSGGRLARGWMGSPRSVKRSVDIIHASIKAQGVGWLKEAGRWRLATVRDA